MTPPASGAARAWLAGLGPGGAPTPLDSANAGALATFFWRSDPPERSESAKGIAELLASAVGPRVPAQDMTKLGQLLGNAADARAAWATVSVTGGAGSGALLRLSATDAPALGSSLEAAVEVVGKPSWAGWEKEALGVTKIERAPGRATFQSRDAALQVAWAVREGELDVGGGIDGASILGGSAHPLSSDGQVVTWLHALGNGVIWALVARPLMLNASPRSDPAMLSLVHAGDQAILRAHVTGIIARQLIVSL
jgi:hypothetical protein